MLSSLFGNIKKKFDPEAPIHSAPPPDPSTPQPVSAAQPNKPLQTSYVSNDVPIPASFLTTDPPDLQPITITPINWPSTKLPEYEGLYAVLLDNVISPSECEALLQLAEASVPDSHKTPGNGGELSSWGPALVNMGMGFEVLLPKYRNSDRIIWDQQELVDRLWERCLRAEGLGERLAVIDNEEGITGWKRKGESQKWKFLRVNQRMRFLKYGGGQFFKREFAFYHSCYFFSHVANNQPAHCDSQYIEKEGNKTLETLFTIHLYLNDSQQEVGKSVDLVGGATSFLSRGEERKVDVDPKAGRVLIFQHRSLLHSGDDVKKGIKYTMRTDIVYERVEEKE